MGVNLSGRSFLKLLDLSTEEIEYLLKLSKNFKDLKRTGTPHRYLEGKNIVLLFEKTSTRTRCAFEVGGMDLGMGVTYLDPGSSQMGKKESIEDTARVLGRFYDGIEFRGFAQSDVEELADKAGITVPITAGIMPFMGKSQISRMVFMCGASLPSPVIKILAKYENDPESLQAAGVDYAARQLCDLKEHGADGLHLYTMNRPAIAATIMERLG